MILDLTSFGWSGCGAYHDLIREYDNVDYPYKGDWEFDFFWAVDGLYDLEYKLCHKHCRIYDSDLAISRFLHLAKVYEKEEVLGYNKVFLKTSFYDLCKDYIEKLVSINIKARCLNECVHPNKKEPFIKIYNNTIGKLLCNRITRKVFGKYFVEGFKFYNPHLMQIAYNPERFDEITQEFVATLLSEIRHDANKVLIMDQMFPPDCPQLFQKYVKEEHKSIIVRRDPRDTYITMKKLTRFPLPIPHSLDDFIWFYKTIVGETILPDTENRISVNFEDLIYQYDATVRKIENFIDIGKHIRPKSKFDPERSKNNTQLVGLYPQFEDDIRVIEKELKDYLFPFEKYSFKRTSNEIF